jgi:dienelactone hydrolase
MTDIALFHSALGVRPGVHAAADLLRSHGHAVHVIDQYDGHVFEDYAEAGAFAQSIGYPALMAAALQATSALPPRLVCAGFSNGGAMAQYVAGTRDGVTAAVLLSGAIDPAELGLEGWPPTVPVQIHYTRDDPFRRQPYLDAAMAAVRSAGADVELFDYPGSGHLFTDPSLPGEYQPVEAEQLWPRVVDFLARLG